MTTPLLRQTWTISAVLINMFGQGLMLGYPTSLLPAINHPDSLIKADLQTSSWLGSIGGVAGVPGLLLSSFLMALYGRRMTHGLAILPGVLGWLLIYFASDMPMLMAGRFFCGLSSTTTTSLGAIVMGEYTSPKYRGIFLCLKNASVCMGAMLMHVVSRYLHWRTIALVSLIPLFIAIGMIFTWPESPAWLASNHQYQKSRATFYWLRGNNKSAKKEIEETIKVQKAAVLNPRVKASYYDMIAGLGRKFTQKNFLKPFFVMVLGTAVLELSGRHIFPAYALHIMTAITGETSQSFYYTLGIDSIVTVSAVFASVFVKMMNRRTLLFSTASAAIAVLMLVCTYLFLVAKTVIADDKSWIPISLLVLYFVLANLGCAPIPLTLAGEIFPLEHRAVGTALSGVWLSICFLAGLKSTPYLLASMGVYGFFTVFGSMMGITLLVLYFVMPETKDKSLQEIENYFNYGKYRDDVDNDEEANTKMIK